MGDGNRNGSDGNGRGPDGRFRSGNIGRTPGTTNKLTKSFRDAVLMAFDGIGGVKAFTVWARDNPTEFYKIAAKLIPREVHARVTHVKPLIIDQVTTIDVEAAKADRDPGEGAVH